MIRLLRNLVPVFALVAAFVVAGSALAAEAKGKIKTVTADKNEFVMNDAEAKAWTVRAGADCKITVNDKEAKLADLQANDEVTITYEKDGEFLKASVVKATRK